VTASYFFGRLAVALARYKKLVATQPLIIYHLLFFLQLLNIVLFGFSEINVESQKAVANGTQKSLAKGPNKDLLR